MKFCGVETAFAPNDHTDRSQALQRGIQTNMDARALNALATSALFPYLAGRDEMAGLLPNGANGAYDPSEVAACVLDVKPEWGAPFRVGVEFALALAAAIAANPTDSPKLDDIIESSRENLRE